MPEAGGPLESIPANACLQTPFLGSWAEYIAYRHDSVMATPFGKKTIARSILWEKPRNRFPRIPPCRGSDFRGSMNEKILPIHCYHPCFYHFIPIAERISPCQDSGHESCASRCEIPAGMERAGLYAFESTASSILVRDLISISTGKRRPDVPGNGSRQGEHPPPGKELYRPTGPTAHQCRVPPDGRMA